MSDLYQQVLLEELQHPQNKYEMVDADVTFHANNASCGDDMTVFLKIDGNVISKITWIGSGCAISQATMSMISEELKGKTITDVSKIDQKYLEQLLGIEEISVGRIKCLMLGLSAVNGALAQTQTA